jgi:putative endonuclease
VSKRVGEFGEAWAAGFLTRKGYQIVDRNVRYRHGEIDIVAWCKDTLVFVEVKCRRGSLFGSPESSITRARYGRLSGAIETYLQQAELGSPEYRIDVLAIELGRDGAVHRSALIENAELPFE